MKEERSHAGNIGLSRRWRAVFRVEIPICAVTVAYWIIAPEHYARRMLGDVTLDIGHRYLILLGASTVGTLLVWFYGRVLFAPSIDLRMFRRLQEGMALGDAGVLALSAWLAIVGHAHAGTLIAQALMAALWGTLRVVFLLSCREPASASGHAAPARSSP